LNLTGMLVKVIVCEVIQIVYKVNPGTTKPFDYYGCFI